MATPTFFESFVTEVVAGTHAASLGADTDVWKAMLTLTSPSASADTIKSELPADEPTGTGYTAGGDDVQNAFSDSGGTITVNGTDVVWTAGAADWDDFRYLALYNDTPSSPLDPLIYFVDYGSTISLGNGETFTYGILTSILTIAIP